MNPPAALAAPAQRHQTIAVAGNPNSGKTTVFNALTGLRLKVANYPGVTVEKREGLLAGTGVAILDLPGAYSLSARSPDEEIARDVLMGRVEGTQRPDAVLIVVDASNLERNLYLASQILDTRTPAVIACNMMDAAEDRGLRIDCELLSKQLGVPVIPTVASRKQGIEELRRALANAELPCGTGRTWKFPDAYEQIIVRIAVVLRESGKVPPHAAEAGALLWLLDYLSGEAASRNSAERFLKKLTDGQAAEIRAAADELRRQFPDAATMAVESRYRWISRLAGAAVSHREAASGRATPSISGTDRIDRVLTHRIFGPLVFAAVMFVLFLSVFWWAEPLMKLIERGQMSLAGVVGPMFHEGPLRSLVTDGILAGVGAVLSFFPQICILFFCLGVLEDTGYMARAAFLMDRLMSRVGLHGKSFIPLLSSYACAIPGILATRTIENRRDRFTTIMVAPLMSCSARLPVYLIVIAAVFGDRLWLKAGVMFGLYLLGTVTALLMALFFKKTIFAGPRPPFILELPPYHMPQLGSLVRTMWDRSKLFLTNAGTTIFAVCVIIWALSYFPHTKVTQFPPAVRKQIAALDQQHTPTSAEASKHLIASEQLRHSFIGRIGHAIEPTIKPLGFDWRLGIGILTSFLAREVFVGTMGITFAVGEADENSVALREKLASATWPDGRKVLTPLTGIGLMAFYVLACQCVSTLAVVRKETGSWRWPALMFGYMSVLAYVGALVVHQVGLRL